MSSWLGFSFGFSWFARARRVGRELCGSLCVVLALGAIGCGGTETGNPGGARLELTLRATDPSVATVRGQGQGLRVDELYLSLASVALVGCPDGHGAGFSDDAVVNLADGALLDGEFPPGEYCGFRFALEPGALPGAGENPNFERATIAVYGASADATAFEIVSGNVLELELPAPAFTLSTEEKLLLAFDVSLWLRENVLDTAVTTDRGLVMDGRDHPAVTERFEMQMAVSLHRDANDNGVVDETEAALAAHH
jgi:hypothetical protein